MGQNPGGESFPTLPSGGYAHAYRAPVQRAHVIRWKALLGSVWMAARQPNKYPLHATHYPFNCQASTQQTCSTL